MKRNLTLLAVALCVGLFTACNTPLGPVIVQNAATAGVTFGLAKYPGTGPYLRAARDLICDMAGQRKLDPAQIVDELDSKIAELKTPEGAVILNAVLSVYEAFYYQFKDRIDASAMASYLNAVCSGMDAALPVNGKALMLVKPSGAANWPHVK